MLIKECYVIHEEVLHLSKENEEKEEEEEKEMNKENIQHNNKKEEG